MSKRVDEREPTQTSLEVYDKCLKLSDHILSVCKPKEKNINNKHIPKRNLGLGRMLTELVVDVGADIIEANTIYVGVNLNAEERKKNYRRRIGLQEHAKSTTYRMEHIIRVLHFNAPFADVCAIQDFFDIPKYVQTLLDMYSCVSSCSYQQMIAVFQHSCKQQLNKRFRR